MEDAILATDLMLFFDNRAKLEEIIKNNKFNWSTPEDRYWLFSFTVQKVKAFTVDQTVGVLEVRSECATDNRERSRSFM